MADQASEASGESVSNIQAQDAAPAAPSAASEVEALRKELAAARKEAAKYRTRNDEELASKLKEQGDYKALYEREAVDRNSFREMSEYLAAQLEAAGGTDIPEYLKTALEAMPSVVGKVKLLQQYQATQSSAKPAPVKANQVPTGAPPAPPASADIFDRVANDPTALRKERERDPEGFMAWVGKLRGPSQPTTTWARMQAAKAKK